MKIKLILIFSTGALLLNPSYFTGWAQSYRESAPISPVYVYKQMLLYAEQGESGKISKLLSSVEEILDALSSNFQQDLRNKITEAINSGSRREILNSIYTLIFYDMKDVFRATVEGLREGLSLAALKERLKFAYLDYLLVSPTARKKEFNLDRNIRKLFTGLLTAELAKAVDEGEASSIESKFDAILNDYRSIFGL